MLESSQGSVETRLMCGGLFNRHAIANLQLRLSVPMKVLKILTRSLDVAEIADRTAEHSSNINNMVTWSRKSDIIHE